MSDLQQSITYAGPETATRSVTESEIYRLNRKRQLLEQCQDIKHLKADINRRKLTHIINTAVSAAFV